MESAHHFSSRPDCTSTADVPSFILRTALSAITLVSDLCGVDVQWFQEKSSQDFQFLGNCHFLVGSKNFGKLFCVFCEVFISHGYDCIHCVAKSHILHWELRDPLLSNHPNVPLWARLYRCVFCKKPLKFCFSSRYRKFGPSGSE